MYHNLTDKQLAVLRWLVERIENGELKESVIISDPAVNLDYDRDAFGLLILSEGPDYLNIGSMSALAADGSFIVNNSLWTITRRGYEVATFDFSSTQTDPMRVYIKETHRLMLERFNREELAQVCFGLSINTDWVFGEKRDWPFELLLYLYRNNRLSELPPVLQKKRPREDWPKYPVS